MKFISRLAFSIFFFSSFACVAQTTTICGRLWIAYRYQYSKDECGRLLSGTEPVPSGYEIYGSLNGSYDISTTQILEPQKLKEVQEALKNLAGKKVCVWGDAVRVAPGGFVLYVKQIQQAY